MTDNTIAAAVARLREYAGSHATHCSKSDVRIVLAALEAAQADARRYEDMLFASGAMETAPCFKCGYNGSGYFQPDKHPCAAWHRAAIDAASAAPRDSAVHVCPVKDIQCSTPARCRECVTGCKELQILDAARAKVKP